MYIFKNLKLLIYNNPFIMLKMFTGKGSAQPAPPNPTSQRLSQSLLLGREAALEMTQPTVKTIYLYNNYSMMAKQFIEFVLNTA